jgi:Zn-dependent protease
MFGYAKPVPVNPSKLQGRDRWGFALVALAGPVSNLLLAMTAAAVASRLYGINADVLRLIGENTQGAIGVLGAGRFILAIALVWNVLLAAFNLVPIPPLDGSRLLRIVLNANGRRTLDRIEPYGFLILFAVIIWLDQPFFRLVTLIESGLLRLLPI